MTERVFEGRTADVDAPFLGAEFWQEGKEISGVVTKIEQGMLDGRPSVSFTLDLDTPVVVDGEEIDRARVGSLSGFTKALEAAGVTTLIRKDAIVLTCEGVRPSKKEGYSGRVNFRIKVVRTS